jgi:hypothetical protein
VASPAFFFFGAAFKAALIAGFAARKSGVKPD